MLEAFKLKDRLAGKQRFPEDMKAKKMRYGLLVYASEAPGVLEEIKLPALGPGVNFFMAEDIPGKNELPYPDEDIPLLADKEILYVGQAVGVLTGPNPDELYTIRKNISMKIREIPSFPPFEENRIIPKENPEKEENSKEGICLIAKGDTSQAFEQALELKEGEFTLEAPEISVHPGQDVLCVKEGGSYHLYLHSQWPSLVRKLCALAAGISRKQLILDFPTTGRGWDAHVGRSITQAALAVCLTSILREPVKIMGEEAPGKALLPQYKILFRYKGAMDEEARLTAIEGEIFMDTGAYRAFSSEVLARLCLGGAGFYNCPNLKIHGKIHRTNKAPWLPMSSWGLSQGNIGMEVFANRLAAEASKDPGDWRITHLPVKGQINNTGGEWKKNCPLEAIINRCSKDGDFKRKYAAARQLEIRGNSPELSLPRYKGTGMAVSLQGCEFVSRDKHYTANAVTMTLHKEGLLEVLLGSIPASPVLLTYWKKMIASKLGMEEDKICLVMDMADEQSFHGPSSLSRNVAISTRLIKQCCEILQKKLFREALPISLTRSYRRRTSGEWSAEEMKGRPFSSPSWACSVMEISIYAATKEISIPGIWLYLDCGPLLDAAAARSYVEAEIRVALGQCLTREAVIPSLFPALNIHFNEDSRKDSGGLEGLALGCIPAAFAQAVSQACGYDIKALPVNPAALLAGDFHAD